MAACLVSAHSIMDTTHFYGDAVHGARNRNCKQQKETVVFRAVADKKT